MSIKWLPEPKESNYPAAMSYLSLIFNPKVASDIVHELREAEVSDFAAKDIYRASGLTLLNASNARIERDKAKVIRGDKLSPLLLCRDEQGKRLIVADGYHRLCAVYLIDESAMIPCKIASV